MENCSMTLGLTILMALFAQLWPNPGPGRQGISGGGTIGYQTIGSDTSGVWNQALIVGSKFAAPANGSNGTLNLYCTASSGTISVGVAVYSDSAGSPTTLLSGNSHTVSCTTTPGWRSVSITGVTWSNGTDYWLTIWPTTGTNVTFYRDAGSANQERYDIPGTWGGTFPGTWPSGGGTFENLKMSIYVTY
jgi:hypothetical protein